MLRSSILTVGVLTAIGCRGHEDPLVVSSKNLAQEWSAAADSSHTKAPEQAKSDSQPVLVIDASRSMAGFVGCKASLTAFDNVVDRFTAAFALTSVVRFGQRAKGGGNSFELAHLDQSVHCPTFYDRLQNPDYELYRAAAEDSLNRTFLYFTDGVQSDWQGSNPGPSLGFLKQWVQKGRGLAILAFRSEFDGPGWSEQRKAMLGRVTANRRPFYLFILSPSDSLTSDLLRKVPKAVGADAVVMRFADDDVQCRADVASEVPKFNTDDVSRWAMIQYSEIGNTPVLLRHRCVFRPEYPLQTVDVRISTTYRSWDGTSFSPASHIASSQFRSDTAVRSGDSSVVQIVGRVPDNAMTRFGLYQFRFDVDPGALAVPVAELSTDSDADPKSFEKSYRFSWLVEELARVSLARLPWSAFTVTLQYR